jgi:hypothetical protein
VAPRFAALSTSLLSLTACSPAPHWIAVASPGQHAVLVLDGRLRLRQTFTLAGAPATLESTGDGSGILVGTAIGADTGALVWLRRADGATILLRLVPGEVGAVRLDRGGGRLFLLTRGPHSGLAILGADQLDERRSIPICPEPESLALTREEDRAYVICQPGTVAEVDPKLGLLLRLEPIGADSGQACLAGRGALSADGTLLLVPCARSGHLLYLDRVTLRPWDSLAVAPGVSVVATTPEGVGVVLLPDSDRVVLLSLARKERIATIPTPDNPVDLCLSASGRFAYVVAAGRDGQPGALLELDTRTGRITNRVALSSGARAVYLWPGPRLSRMYWAPAAVAAGTAVGR